MRALITGGTGSLGHALVRRWTDSAERIVVFSRDEWKQAEMARIWPDTGAQGVRYFLGDVRDKERLQQAMVGIDTVIHAAALKRVDAVAYNPVEVLKTNVLGTQAVIEAAVAAGVARVVVVSSDKAVSPSNVYGSSKNMAEHLAVSSNVYAVPRGTRVSVVRYGNVAWSRGSVMWAWEQALTTGQVVSVTDLEMTRFWLTLDRAVDTIEFCLANMEGGEIFIPRISAAPMTDILRAMWAMLRPALLTERGKDFVEGGGEIGVGYEVTGLRPGGEKLHETLLGIEEVSRACAFMEYFCLYPHLATWRPTATWRSMEPLPSNVAEAYSSDTAPRMSQEEIMALLASRPV